ncbi:MAG: hypothetical protein Q9181_001703 [Wetmoreana brouardii]
MKVYGFGSNGSGQLGIGGTEDTSLPQPCLLLDNQEWPSPIESIRGGGSHTLVLLESGQLYASGSLSHRRTGLTTSEESTSRFRLVPSCAFGGSKVKLCSGLWEASIVVTNDNEIYAFGLGPKGELGTGQGLVNSSHRLDRFCPKDEQIVDVSSGMAHTVIILSNGDAYGWGNGRKGQLGEPAEIVWKPRRVQNLSFKVVRAVCGRDFSYLLGAPGDGHHATLGSDKWKVRSAAPVDVRGWREVAASWSSILLLRGSDFLAWGRDDHGQLGPEVRPTLLVDIVAGSEHAVVVTQQNLMNGVVLGVASWGWGEHGNCGLGVDSQGDVKGRWSEIDPYSFGKNSKVMGIAAGCATSFVWTDEAADLP